MIYGWDGLQPASVALAAEKTLLRQQ